MVVKASGWILQGRGSSLYLQGSAQVQFMIHFVETAATASVAYIAILSIWIINFNNEFHPGRGSCLPRTFDVRPVLLDTFLIANERKRFEQLGLPLCANFLRIMLRKSPAMKLDYNNKSIEADSGTFTRRLTTLTEISGFDVYTSLWTYCCLFLFVLVRQTAAGRNVKISRLSAPSEVQWWRKGKQRLNI